MPGTRCRCLKAQTGSARVTALFRVAAPRNEGARATASGSSRRRCQPYRLDMMDPTVGSYRTWVVVWMALVLASCFASGPMPSTSASPPPSSEHAGSLPPGAASDSAPGHALACPPSDGPAAPPPTASVTFRVYRAANAWAAEIPTTWSINPVEGAHGFDSAIFRTYDPLGSGVERPAAPADRPTLPSSELRIDVLSSTSGSPGSAREAADAVLVAVDPAHSGLTVRCRRDDLTIAGQRASLVVEERRVGDRRELLREYSFLSPVGDRLVHIIAWPGDTAHGAELDRFLSSFAFD